MSAEVKTKQQRGESLGKEPEMAYKKPEVVAKSEAKQSFVAGCPEKNPYRPGECNIFNKQCASGPLR